MAFHRDTAKLASTYDKTSVHQLEHGKQLISALSVANGDCVLDIGAGTGLLAAHVAEIVGPSGFVVAMDPLPLRVEIAQSKAAGNVEACVGRAEDLSQFTDESFNVVYLNSVFHWVEDKPRAVAEIFRVLTPDGRIGLTYPDPTRPHEAFQFIRRALTEVGANHNRSIARLDVPTDYELERLLTSAGFVAYESDYWTFANVYPDVDTLLASIESASFGISSSTPPNYSALACGMNSTARWNRNAPVTEAFGSNGTCCSQRLENRHWFDERVSNFPTVLQTHATKICVTIIPIDEYMP